MTVLVLLLFALYMAVGGVATSFLMSKGACTPYTELTQWEVLGIVLTWPVWFLFVLVISFAMWCVEAGLLLFGDENSQ